MGCCDCKTGEKSRIVYACAGCADVGEVSDLVSRKLRQIGFAQKTASCLAGIGAGIESFIQAAKDVDEVVTIDGCGIACARKMIEGISIQPTAVILTDMGLEKGKTHVTLELVEDLCQRIINSKEASSEACG